MIYGKIIRLEIEYKDLKTIEYYLKREKINISNVEYKDKISLNVEVTEEDTKKIENMINNKIILANNIEIIEEKYITKNI